MSFFNEISNMIKEEKNEAVRNYIISNNIDINEISNYSPLLINIAIRFNNIKLIKILYELGAFLDIEDSDGLSPIENAAWNNNREAIDFIIKEESNISVFHLENALQIAIAKGNTDASACLIKHGVAINQNSLDRLLYISSIRGENENIKTFYLNGASLNSKNDGINPITGAIRNKNNDTVKFLVKIGGEDVGFESALRNVSKEDWFSYVYNNELDMVKHSIAKAGSNIVKTKNKDDEQALEISVRNHDDELVKWLVKFYDKMKDKDWLESIFSKYNYQK